ncbi:PucR family transcriptional regulator [Streptomyces sp. NPDC050400]|uniref:PucR family transcriptional regulator n=1 Tax=Streptomyces sp. NPDC050400 TaxID=3365610 RepID=UPI00378A5C0E
MPTLAELLTAPGLTGLHHLAGPLDAAPVTGVRLETRADRIPAVPPGTVAILLSAVPGHLLDVAVRDAAAAGATALVLAGDTRDGAPPSRTPDAYPGVVPGAYLPAAPAPARALDDAARATLRSLADRGRVAVLEATGDLAALVVAVDRAVAGDAADALARVAAAAQRLPGDAGDPERAAATAARALGVPVERRVPGPGETGASAPGPDGEIALAAPDRPGHAGTAARCVLGMAVLAAAGGGHGDLPVRSRGHLLAELLAAPQERTAGLAARGRALGLPVDGHHTALRVEAPGLPPADRYHLLDSLTGQLLTRLRAPGDGTHWHAALVDDALVLLGTRAATPGPEARRATLALARRTLDTLGAHHPEAGLRGGLGAAHRGPLGIRTSAREARAALLTPPDGTSVSAHDAAGLDRMLLEWYASDTAHEATTELLAPVLKLGQDKAEPLLRTLQAYLDHNNSPARAADLLHLHRNAVGARIRRITDLTGADLTDPDTRLALQLACRARLSGMRA